MAIARIVHLFEPRGEIRNPGAGFPGWEVRRWRRGELRAAAADFVCKEFFLNGGLEAPGAGRLLRLELLRLFGGVAADPGWEFFAPLEEVMLEDCLHFAFEGPALASAALLAAPAGFGLFEPVLGRARLALRGYAEAGETALDLSALCSARALRLALGLWTGGCWEAHEMRRADGAPAGWLYDHADLAGWAPETVWIAGGSKEPPPPHPYAVFHSQP